MKYQIISETDRKALQTRLIIAKHTTQIDMRQKIIKNPKIILKITKNNYKNMKLKLLIYEDEETEKPLFGESSMKVFPKQANQRAGILSLLSREINEILNEAYNSNININFDLQRDKEQPKLYTAEVKFKKEKQDQKSKNNT